MSDLNNSNRDPLTGTPGAHPVGTGLGAAGGAGAGAAMGAVGGPVGAVVGGVVGAVAGGLAGKATAETVNPTAEDAYWREAHTSETYYEPGRSYDQDYRPAYALGWSPVGADSAGSFDAVEPRLRERWENERGVSTLDWEQARAPARASWERTYGTSAMSRAADLSARDYAARTDAASVPVDVAQNNANRDPITDEPGAHPVGTGVGAALGGAGAGAAAGAFGGPVGAVVGGVIGAVAGGLAGKAAAEAVNPTVEDAYWREAHTSESYYEPGRSYDQDYRPAYALGWSAADTDNADSFDAVEPRLRERWENERGVSTLDWEQARAPARASWERAYGSSADAYAAGGASTMAMAGEAMDNEDVVDVLNNLMESCRDGEQGFRASAEQAVTGDLQALLIRRSTDCGVAAAELEQVVRSYGAEPADGGTVAGALHRGWVAIKAALSSNDDQAVLEECERGEDAMVARYRNALEKPLPSTVRVLVQRQFEQAQRHHDEIRGLRDQYQRGV